MQFLKVCKLFKVSSAFSSDFCDHIYSFGTVFLHRLWLNSNTSACAPSSCPPPRLSLEVTHDLQTTTDTHAGLPGQKQAPG